MKKLITILATIVMAFSFVSCEKETIATPGDLLGDWELSEAQTDVFKKDANGAWVPETSTTTVFPTDKLDICFRIADGHDKDDLEMEITVFNQLNGKYYILGNEDFELDDDDLMMNNENISAHLLKVGRDQLSLDVTLIIKNQKLNARVSARSIQIDDSKIVKLPL